MSPDAKDNEASLRAARAQAAVVRALAELQREQRGDGSAESLKAQAVEESARLVAVVEDLARRRSVAPESPRQPGATADARRPSVLVVEDEEATRQALVQGLEHAFDVTAAASGEEGIAAASRARFDAVVSDIRMPGMDGVTMVERIRRLRSPEVVPVIFLTGETMPERVAAGFSAGGTGYLVKPVDLELLEQEIRMAVARSPD